MVRIVRRRVVVMVVVFALALALGFTGRATDVEALDVLSGLFWIAGIVLALSLLPFWSRVLPRIEPMHGLFEPVDEGQRWCSRCGTPTAQHGPCHVCGHERPVKVRKPREQTARR